jgi:hypothetical protein
MDLYTAGGGRPDLTVGVCSATECVTRIGGSCEEVRRFYAPDWGYLVAVNGSLGCLVIVGRHYTLQLTVLPHAQSGATPPLSG